MARSKGMLDFEIVFGAMSAILSIVEWKMGRLECVDMIDIALFPFYSNSLLSNPPLYPSSKPILD